MFYISSSLFIKKYPKLDAYACINCTFYIQNNNIEDCFYTFLVKKKNITNDDKYTSYGDYITKQYFDT